MNDSPNFLTWDGRTTHTIGALFMIALLMFMALHFWGTRLIDDAYHERSISLLNNLFDRPIEHSLAYYQDKAARILYAIFALMICSSFVLLVWPFAFAQFGATIRNFYVSAETRRLLVLLVLIDGMLVVLHVTHVIFGHPASRMFAIDVDRGLPEIFQYVKEASVAVWFGLLALKRASALFLPWSALFAYLLFDDSLELHERLGHSFVDFFGLVPMLGLRAQDFGELLVTALFGTALLSGISAAHYHADPNYRALSWSLLLLIGTLGFFGVAVDMLPALLPQRIFYHFIILAEDAGEMVVMSVIAWFVLSMSIGKTRPSLSS